MSDPIGQLEEHAHDVGLRLNELDVDGALRETADTAFTASRAGFLSGAAVGAGALVAGAAWPATARARSRMTKNDVDILNFDVALEYLQSSLYTEAERLGALKPETLGFARVVGAHERAHLAALKSLLGRRAVKSASFNFGGVTEDDTRFVRTAVAFEDLTAALLKWQAVRLDSRDIFAAAVTLHSVETRHAAWIRRRVGLRPVASAFDRPRSQRDMARLIASTRFVVAPARTTRRRRRPKFTG